MSVSVKSISTSTETSQNTIPTQTGTLANDKTTQATRNSFANLNTNSPEIALWKKGLCACGAAVSLGAFRLNERERYENYYSKCTQLWESHVQNAPNANLQK